jgi:hypothetical protein
MAQPAKIRTKKLLSFDGVPNGVAGTIFKISVCIVLFAWFLFFRTFPVRGKISFEPIQPLMDVFGAIYVAAFFYILHYGALKFAKSRIIKTTWFVLEGIIIVLVVAVFMHSLINRSNQSSDPTPTSVTSVAGQPPRQP